MSNAPHLHHRATHVYDEKLDPRPPAEPFAQWLVARMRETTSDAAVAYWLRGCGDRESLWVSLRTLEHWIERAGN